jgi:hypothetical protein
MLWHDYFLIKQQGEGTAPSVPVDAFFRIQFAHLTSPIYAFNQPNHAQLALLTIPNDVFNK